MSDLYAACVMIKQLDTNLGLSIQVSSYSTDCVGFLPIFYNRDSAVEYIKSMGGNKDDVIVLEGVKRD